MSRKQQATSQELHVGNQTVAYTLTFANRKSVGITIRRNGTVEVRAPQGISHATITDILHQRASWILRNLEKFAKPLAQPPARDLPNGPYYPFLGRNLPLMVKRLTAAPGNTERVELAIDRLYVWVKEPADQARINTLLEKWSREQAATLFLRRMTDLLLRFKGYQLPIPNLKIRRMRARWGSCSTHGTITLNLKLVQFDEALIDYVIVHELCHLIEHNHSKQYYALLARMMPDWKARREQLNALGMPD